MNRNSEELILKRKGKKTFAEFNQDDCKFFD